MSGIKQVRSGTKYETKTVMWHWPEAGTKVSVMMTAFDVGENEALGRVGYQGRYVMFNILEGGERNCSYDPFKIRDVGGDGSFREFLLKVREGWRSGDGGGIEWNTIQDGQTFVRGEHNG